MHKKIDFTAESFANFATSSQASDAAEALWRVNHPAPVEPPDRPAPARAAIIKTEKTGRLWFEVVADYGYRPHCEVRLCQNGLDTNANITLEELSALIDQAIIALQCANDGEDYCLKYVQYKKDIERYQSDLADIRSAAASDWYDWREGKVEDDSDDDE